MSLKFFKDGTGETSDLRSLQKQQTTKTVGSHLVEVRKCDCSYQHARSVLFNSAIELDFLKKKRGPWPTDLSLPFQYWVDHLISGSSICYFLCSCFSHFFSFFPIAGSVLWRTLGRLARTLRRSALQILLCLSRSSIFSSRTV